MSGWAGGATRLAGVALGVAALAVFAGRATGAPPGSGANEQQQASGTVFFDALDVELVTIDVYVSDRQGNPVTGLERADFELLEDGRPVAISHFEAVAGRPRDVPRPGLPPAPPVSGPATDAAAAPPPPPEAPEPLTLVIYVDNTTLRPFDRNRVGRQARELLDRLAPGDRVMVASFDKSFHLRQQLTTDVTAAAAALVDLEAVVGYGAPAASERREVLRRVDQSDDAQDAEALVDLYVKSAFHDARQSLRALDELVGSLGGLPGRKALLYVGEGIPGTVGEDLFQLLEDRFGRRGTFRLTAARYRLDRSLAELAGRANANRVTLYTLGASGMRSAASLSAEHGALSHSMIDVDAIHQMNLWASLQRLADDTGGLSAFNTNDVAAAFERMVRDFDTYYALGYSPPHGGDGRYHEIEVRVRRPGLTVRHRDGYRGKTAATRLAEGTLAALLYRVESNAMGASLELEPARADGAGRYLVPLEARIPIAPLALVPRADGHEGMVRVAVMVLDEEGRSSPLDQQLVPIRVPAGELELARRQHFVYAVELLMRPGDQEVAVGLHDEVSGASAFLRRRVRVGR